MSDSSEEYPPYPLKDRSTQTDRYNYFTGLVAGYAHGSGIDLWSFCDGATFQIYNGTDGTWSQKIVRTQRTIGETGIAFAAAIREMPHWLKGPPAQNAPPGLFGSGDVYGEPT